MNYRSSYSFVLAAFVIFMGLSFISPSAAFAEDPPPNRFKDVQPAYRFNYMGKRIRIYYTETPGIYESADGQRWVEVKTGGPMLIEFIDTVSKNVVITANVPGEEHRNFIHIENATMEQIAEGTRLTMTEIYTFRDHRGEEWIKVPAEGEIPERFVRVAQATEGEIMAAYARASWKDIPLDAAKRFIPENIKFSTAQLLLIFATCFGSQMSPTNLTFQASYTSPTCLTDFVTHLLSPEGWASFYFFIVGHRLTSQSLMKMLLETARMTGQTSKVPYLKAKYAQVFGWLGMAGGMFTSQVAHHFFTAPSFGVCIKEIPKAGIFTHACTEAVKHFTTIEGFWDDMAGGSASMITSSIAAHLTQKYLLSNKGLLQQLARTGAAGGWKLLAGNPSALVTLGHAGNAIKVLRGLIFVGGVPGFVIQVGHFVLFLAWDEFFKYPFMRGWHDLTKSGKVKDGIAKIDLAAPENQKLKWNTPWITREEQCTRKRLNRTEFRTECKEILEEPLTVGLDLLSYGAQMYRKKVLLDTLDKDSMGWATKTNNYINNYKLSKILLEHIYKNKPRTTRTSLNLTLTAQNLARTWRNAFEYELVHTNPDKTKILQLLDQLERESLVPRRVYEPEKTFSMTDKSTWGNLWSIAFSVPLQKLKDTTFADDAKENNLRALLINFQKEIASRAGRLNMNSDPNSSFTSTALDCSYMRYTCDALSITERIDFNAIRNNQETYMIPENDPFMIAATLTFGPDLLNKVFFNYICNQETEFLFRGTGNDGWAAHFGTPRLISFSNDRDARNFERENCWTRNGFGGPGPMAVFTTNDIAKMWVVNGRPYSDALSMLQDNFLPLVSGLQARDAFNWWQTKAFPKTSEFLRNMTIRYQGVLQDRFFNEVPAMTVDELILRTRPNMRGPELDHHIVTLQLDMWNRPKMSESMMGQVTYILDKIKYYGPACTPSGPLALEAATQNRFNWFCSRKDKLLKEIQLAIGEYILGLNSPVEHHRIFDAWSKYESDVQVAGTDYEALAKTNEDFRKALYEIGLGPEKIAVMQSQRATINRLLGELYSSLANYDYDDLFEQEDYREHWDTDYVSKLSTPEYKKYIFFVFAHDSLHKIVVEIDELYDRLGLKPMTDLPQFEL